MTRLQRRDHLGLRFGIRTQLNTLNIYVIARRDLVPAICTKGFADAQENIDIAGLMPVTVYKAAEHEGTVKPTRRDDIIKLVLKQPNEIATTLRCAVPIFKLREIHRHRQLSVAQAILRSGYHHLLERNT